MPFLPNIDDAAAPFFRAWLERPSMKRKGHEEKAEEETGATSGMTHDEVLERALGHERATRAGASEGQGAPQRKKE